MFTALLIWAVYSITLPPPTCQRCFKVNETQCRDANVVPGSDLAGEGFDITKMERKGAYVIDMNTWLQNDKTCMLCQNPYMKRQKQRLPVSVTDWRSSQNCKRKVSGSVYQSSEALVSSTTSSINNNWKMELGIKKLTASWNLMLAGSNSKVAEYTMQKTKKDKFNFASHEVSCGFYSYRLSNSPLIHPDLKQEFNKLPQRYNANTKAVYFQLIDRFGTHYFSKVTLGGKVRSVTSIKQCEAAIQNLSADEVKACLDVEASVSVIGQVSADLAAANAHCKQKKKQSRENRSFSSAFNDRESDVIGGHTDSIDLLFSGKNDPKAYKEWMSSLPEHPDVISYSLNSLHELLPTGNPNRMQLRNAIKDYVLQRGLWKNCTTPCRIGIKTNVKEPCSCSCHGNSGVAPNCCPTQRGFATITVTAVSASGLYGDYFTSTDGYVKVLHNGHFKAQTDVIVDNNSPNWNRKFYMGENVLSSYRTVTLEVWDEDSADDDDLLGRCNIQLKSGKTENFCALTHGVLNYKVEVTCIPSLRGPMCTEYTPSPMDAELEKVYVSRHARPIPGDMLLQMGVLLDESIPRFNQSSMRKANGFKL